MFSVFSPLKTIQFKFNNCQHLSNSCQNVTSYKIGIIISNHIIFGRYKYFYKR